MSCPPTSKPWNTSTSRFARAAYRAAVYPAGPEPTITTSYVSDIPNTPLIYKSSTSTILIHRASRMAQTFTLGGTRSCLTGFARLALKRYHSGYPLTEREDTHGRARETRPRRAGGRALPRRVRPAAGRWGGCVANCAAGGDQRERQAQLEADQRLPRPVGRGPLPGLGHDRLLLRLSIPSRHRPPSGDHPSGG